MGIVLNPPNPCLPHVTEELIERYVLHRLSATLAAQFEEHLLTCERCQEAVTAADQFVAAMKSAAVRPSAAPSSALWRFGGIAPVVACGLLALIVVWQRPSNAPGAPVAVSLSSLRAVKASSPAPAGKPLNLSMDLPDLRSEKYYELQIVDSAGRLAWRGPATQSGDRLKATVTDPLGSGTYWVRLYGPQANLIREFSLRTE